MVTEHDPVKHAEQREAILHYIAKRPHASDTVMGVVEWWLPMQRYQDSVEEIELILDELVADGLVTKQTLPDNKTVYTCAKAGQKSSR